VRETDAQRTVVGLLICGSVSDMLVMVSCIIEYRSIVRSNLSILASLLLSCKCPVRSNLVISVLLLLPRKSHTTQFQEWRSESIPERKYSLITSYDGSTYFESCTFIAPVMDARSMDFSSLMLRSTCGIR
jgi:hypothetical protein